MYVLTDGKAVLDFPYSLVGLRRDNPNTSFPNNLSEDELAEWGVLPVVPQNPPDHDPATENLNQANPTYIRGQWQQAWAVSAASPEEVAERLEQQSSLMRQERNQRLEASDWTQLPDAPANIGTWATYRQALRDVTGQNGFPWAVIWPAQPEA